MNMKDAKQKKEFSMASAGGLVWNADLTLEDFNAAVQARQKAIEEASANRPRTAVLEREIMVAVIGLYIIILGGFAILHGYAAMVAEPETEQAELVTERHER